MTPEQRRAEPLTAEGVRRDYPMSLYRKSARTMISDVTFPPGTVYQTPEGLRAEDEDTRAALDVQGGIYPIRESVFQASYVSDAALDPRVERLEAALQEAYTLLVSAEPTLIRDARYGPSEVSLHYKAMLRDKVGEWLAPYRDDFDGGLRALLRSPQERSGQ